jgi:hypothetical protein
VDAPRARSEGAGEWPVEVEVDVTPGGRVVIFEGNIVSIAADGRPGAGVVRRGWDSVVVVVVVVRGS